MTTAFENLIRSGRSQLLACAFLALLPVLAFAGNGGGGSGGGYYSPQSSSPGDEVTSLPFAQATSGVTFVGSLSELRALNASFGGSALLTVQRLADRRLAVTVVGSARIEVDRLALARSSVEVLFVGGQPFRGGMARLQILSSSPVVLGAERVPLPLARLAASTLTGDVLMLDAAGVRGAVARVRAALTADRVVLLQRETF